MTNSGMRGALHGSRTQILYLDFDGVLHPEAVFWHPRRGVYLHPALAADGHRLFEHAQFLEELLEPYPDVRIVLSTSWVPHFGFSRARGFLTPSLQARTIGATFHTRMDKQAFGLLPRGQQVLADVWRRRTNFWLALDDTDDGWDGTQENVVIADPVGGLASPDVVARVRQALTRFC